MHSTMCNRRLVNWTSVQFTSLPYLCPKNLEHLTAFCLWLQVTHCF